VARGTVVLLLFLLTSTAGCGSHKSAAPTGFTVGAVDDAAQFGDPTQAMQLAASSGLGAIDLSAVWHRGLRAPPAADLGHLRSAADAAHANGIRPLVSVYALSGDTPVSETDRADFAAFAASIPKAIPLIRDVIVGNEPNLNLFWLPQFGPGGQDAAAAGFEQLLAETYDALKQVGADVDVIGGGIAPRGSDDPQASRQTHSPTQFLLDLGHAYRASGRSKPIMDALSIHTYGESSRIPPTLAHPRVKSIGFADYEKLRGILGEAFDRTRQPGRDLPIVYGEYGVETTIPEAKSSLYAGREVITPVDEATQGGYYVQAIQMAACQPTVRMLLLFHVADETRLEGLQSGVRYADGSPKSSLAPVRDAAVTAAKQGCTRR
jgi:hypothetical protein